MVCPLYVVIKELNGHYHSCLDKCKLLKSRGIDTGGAGIDQQFLNNTADKLIYEHAIELVRISVHLSVSAASGCQSVTTMCWAAIVTRLQFRL